MRILPYRKTPRAQWHDYVGGAYFVTICTKDRIHHFGEVVNGVVRLNAIGEALKCQIEQVSASYPYAVVSKYVIMPNHVHLIVEIAVRHEIHPNSQNIVDKNPMIVGSLGAVVRGIKARVSFEVRKRYPTFEWQSRYHDHIIRNQSDRERIANYIERNPANWADDCFNAP